MELKDLTAKDRELLTKKLIEEVILPTWKQLTSWNALTSQTAQIDFGYLAQHMVSVIAGIKGTHARGKGLDLEDGSEVKAASCLSAADTPRWNKINGKAVSVAEMKERLESMPYFFFVLLDTTKKAGDILRCRIWAVRPKEDVNFRNVALEWARRAEIGEIKSDNLQLHPPRWEKGDDNITTNECGYLKLPLIYESVQLNVPGILVMKTTHYAPELLETGLSEVANKETANTKATVIVAGAAAVAAGLLTSRTLRRGRPPKDEDSKG